MSTPLKNYKQNIHQKIEKLGQEIRALRLVIANSSKFTALESSAARGEIAAKLLQTNELHEKLRHLA